MFTNPGIHRKELKDVTNVENLNELKTKLNLKTELVSKIILFIN
jgi:hypothetical protein